jgi:hypothetical protein
MLFSGFWQLFLQSPCQNKQCCSNLLPSLVPKVQKTSSSGLKIRTVFVVVAFVPVISLLKQKIWPWRHSFIMLSSWATEISFTRRQIQESFGGRGFCFCNLLFETKNFGLGAVLVLCLVSEVQKPSSPGIEPRTVFGDGCGPYFCNLLFETNNFGLGSVLLSCLVSELQEPPSPGIELRTLFRSFYLPEFSSCSQEISMPSLVQIGFSLLEL